MFRLPIQTHTLRCPLFRIVVLALGLCGWCGCSATSTYTTPAGLFVLAERPSRDLQKESLRKQWEAWGRQNLCDGDVVFVMGESRILMGFLNFSKFSAEIAESDYSHVGVIAIEDGEPVVYDIISEGALRRPWGQYVTDGRVWAIAVRRLHPAYRDCIPAAVEFCRRVYREQPKFDEEFRPNNGRYYCAELVETAFRQAGQPLCDPIRIKDLPGFHRLSPLTIHLVEATTSLTRDQEVVMPGNATYGIWSCPLLLTVLEKTDSKSPPPLAPIARLPRDVQPLR